MCVCVGWGGGGGVGEEKDKLHVCGPSSALLNIICKVVHIVGVVKPVAQGWGYSKGTL